MKDPAREIADRQRQLYGQSVVSEMVHDGKEALRQGDTALAVEIVRNTAQKLQRMGISTTEADGERDIARFLEALKE